MVNKMVQYEALAAQGGRVARWAWPPGKQRDQGGGALSELRLRVGRHRGSARPGRQVLGSECRILDFKHRRQYWVVMRTRSFFHLGPRESCFRILALPLG